ncbi:MAG: cation-translocating P-type ATPase [Oceanicaulis sp.]
MAETDTCDLPDHEALAERAWHAEGAQSVADRLNTEPEAGLDAEEVEARRERYGSNTLPSRERDSLFRVVLRQFKDPLIYVLLAAGIVSVAIGNVSDALFIFAVLVLNAGLGAYQEYRAASAAEALEKVIEIRASVVRGGETQEVGAEDLVPGDIVKLEAGSAVPADIRLLSSKSLRSDESLLTGESTPVEKDAEAKVEEDASTGDRATLLHAGSAVLSGEASGVVVRTGAQTEVGRIADALSGEEQAPPLVLRMRRFTRLIAYAVLAFVLILGLAQWARGASLGELFLLTVALSVSAIPAGLPVAITVALSAGSNRMAKRNVIVRKLPAVEGLGACDVIASDKTGTLTQNRLTARSVRRGRDEGAAIEVTGPGDTGDGAFRRDDTEIDPADEDWLCKLIVSGALCNNAALDEGEDGALEPDGDMVDVAFLVMARKAGFSRDDLLDDHEQLSEIPFQSERRFAASFNRHDGAVIAHVKGAAEAVADMCEIEAATVTQAADAFAAEGYRVLAVARGDVNEDAAKDEDADALTGLEFLGLVGIIDPVREEVPGAVSDCRDAGISVRMITGDHPSTALAIGRELGFANKDDEAVTGDDLEGEADEALAERIETSPVFARVEPLQKTKIVGALRDRGHFVAVTGDGVNDAPALRDAHIGVAMGEGGTDVARNAADLILTDDNFASIVHGVEEGRIAYDNVRKVIWLLVSTAVAELVLFTLSVLFNTPPPLTPVQLLWLNLVTNGIQDVALALEKGEHGVLKRKPRRPGEPIFDRLMIEEVLTSGVYMGVVAFAAFYVMFEIMGLSEFEARNLLVMLMVLFENVHVFNVRSESRSAFRIPLSNNWVLVGGVALAQGVHIASAFIPGWREVLQIEPVSLTAWLVLLAITLSKFAVVETYKGLRGRKLAMKSYGLA